MRRLPLVLAALLAAAPFTVANAAGRKPPKPKPTCRLVTDSQGDARGVAGAVTNAQGDTGLDVVSADLATNATQATVVFRLPGLNNTDPLSPAGRWFALAYTAAGKRTTVPVLLTPRGNTWGSGAAADAGTVDTATAEIRVTVPLAEAGLAGLKAGTVVSGFAVTTKRWVGAASTGQVVGDAVDTATSTATYKVGWPSCVRVGGDVAGA